MQRTDFTLPERQGEKPETPSSMPHLQHSQNASAAIYQELAKWLFSLEHVEERRSQVSILSTRAAWLSESYQDVNPIAQREFTHIHTEPGPGSQHTSLLEEDAAEVLGKGWGEPHPINDQIPQFELLMVYAPRDAEELEIIKRITLRAYHFILNKPQDGSGSTVGYVG